MLYQGIIGGGSSPVEDLSPVLLWTNSSPTSEFASQTVSLDLSKYTGIIIEGNTSNTIVDYGFREFIKIGESKCCGRINTDYQHPSVRVVTVNSDSVVIGNSYANINDVDNLTVIPTKIYGVKEYVIEPVLVNIPFIRTTTDKGSTTEEQITATFDVTAFNNVDIESYLVKSNPTYGMYVIYKDDTVVVREVANNTVHNNLHIDVSNNTKLKIVGYLNSSAASDLVKFELTNIVFS